MEKTDTKGGNGIKRNPMRLLYTSHPEDYATSWILFKAAVIGEIADETDQHWTFLLCLIKLPESWNLNCTWRCSVQTDSPASQVIESNWSFACGPNIWETSISPFPLRVYTHKSKHL